MKAILFDVTRCTGCMTCVAACAETNGLPDPRRFVRHHGQLGADRFTTLVNHEGRSIRRQCYHCLEPACAAACLVGALRRTPEGPVVYDASKCIGCRYCMLACPFGALSYEWNSNQPLVRKCQMCHDRPAGPACVAACPHQAAELGERESLLRIARERIAAAPDRYLPWIHGETEMGGTALLFLTDVPLDDLWPTALKGESIPDRILPLAKTTPILFFGVGGLLSGLAFVIRRRNRLAAEAARMGRDDDAA